MTPARRVRRDQVLGDAAEHDAGPGTYRDGDVVRASFDGDLEVDDARSLSVTRPRRPLPNARRRKGEAPPEGAGGPGRGAASTRGGAHRHGVGKHGRPMGKKRKGRGDQGTWD